MKKPKIADGNWFVRKRLSTPKKTVCEIGIEFYVGANPGHNIDETSRADAIAISAVPEMIDALIKARQCYQGVGDFESCGRMMMGIIPDIENALKKAGCIE